MTTPKGFEPFNLEVPRKRMTPDLSPMSHPCPVCGVSRQYNSGWWSPSDPQAGRHKACDRQIADWERQAATVDADPEVQAAEERVAEAQAESDRIWEAKLRTLGLPDWIVNQQIARHSDRGREW